jgi:hypothetical protein
MQGHATREGADGFIADLADCGVIAVVEGPVVKYTLTPVDGVLAGSRVATAVGLAELVSWPATAPHWVHLPPDVVFPNTYTQANNTLQGWVCHSRNIGTWTPEGHPGRKWLAHVRTVLGQVSQMAA